MVYIYNGVVLHSLWYDPDTHHYGLREIKDKPPTLQCTPFRCFGREVLIDEPLEFPTRDGAKLSINQCREAFIGKLDIDTYLILALDLDNNLYSCREDSIVTPVDQVDLARLETLAVEFKISRRRNLIISLPGQSHLLHENVSSFNLNTRYGSEGDLFVVTNQQRVLWLRNFPREYEVIDLTDQIPYVITLVEESQNLNTLLLTSNGQVLVLHRDVLCNYPENCPRFDIEDSHITIVELPIPYSIRCIRGAGHHSLLLTMDGQLFLYDPGVSDHDHMLKLDLDIVIRSFCVMGTERKTSNLEVTTKCRIVVKDKFSMFHYISWCNGFQNLESRVLDLPSRYEFDPRDRHSIGPKRSTSDSQS